MWLLGGVSPFSGNEANFYQASSLWWVKVNLIYVWVKFVEGKCLVLIENVMPKLRIQKDEDLSNDVIVELYWEYNELIKHA